VLYSLSQCATFVLAVAGKLHQFGGILAVLTAVFLTFWNRALARRVSAHSLYFVGHKNPSAL
jgi:hypothetical protein